MKGTSGNLSSLGTLQVPARWAAVVAVLAVLVVVAGGVVRVSGAGLGCPDWPLCYGQLLPPGAVPAVIEFTHRLVAGFFGLAVLWLAWASLRVARLSESFAPRSAEALQWLASTAVGALGLVAVQVVLGGLNVLTELAPAVGASHVVAAMALVGVLWAAAELARAARDGVEAGAATQRRRQEEGARWAWLAAILVLAVASLGALVRATGASLACPDVPLCRGRVLPEPAWPVVLHWSHRAGAVLLGVVLAAAAWRVGGRFWWALGLYAGQVGLGVLGVVWRLPPEVRVLHLGVAAVLVGVLGSTVAQRALQARLASRFVPAATPRAGPAGRGSPHLV